MRRWNHNLRRPSSQTFGETSYYSSPVNYLLTIELTNKIMKATTRLLVEIIGPYRMPRLIDGYTHVWTWLKYWGLRRYSRVCFKLPTPSFVRDGHAHLEQLLHCNQVGAGQKTKLVLHVKILCSLGPLRSIHHHIDVSMHLLFHGFMKMVMMMVQDWTKQLTSTAFLPKRQYHVVADL